MSRLARGVIAAMFLLTGCMTSPAKTYHCSGYVRSVWADRWKWSIVIEGDDGVIFTITGARSDQDTPPVWQGLHAEVIYQAAGNPWIDGGGYTNLQVIRRLP